MAAIENENKEHLDHLQSTIISEGNRKTHLEEAQGQPGNERLKQRRKEDIDAIIEILRTHRAEKEARTKLQAYIVSRRSLATERKAFLERITKPLEDNMATFAAWRAAKSAHTVQVKSYRITMYFG